MATLAASPPPVAPPAPHASTVWGLDPQQLHSRFWASRGVQVVRQGEPTELVRHAELFLLTDPRTMAIFRPARIVERLAWVDADLMVVRITDRRDRGYREHVVTGPDGRFIRFERRYGGHDPRLARVALTADRDLAGLWQSAPDTAEGWRRLRRAVSRGDRWTMSTDGRIYDRSEDAEVARFVRDLAENWPRPDAAIDGIRRIAPGVWAADGARVDGARFTGPVWIGAGRTLAPGTTAVGPTALWDNPDARPDPAAIRWLDLEPTAPPPDPVPRRATGLARAAKRLFDVAFSLAALAVTLPLYPFIMLAILLEDGTPFFFTHRRETIGGRSFPCIKFRSMRRDAERIKRELALRNQADGPQFFMRDDPRLTRVGAFLRKCQLDELPQFINVLLGHMSVVGPRPSPFSENQFCPGWREARLSVRPGITGLWQIKRTRAAGADFQEWIKYDIQYVENASLALDLWIIWKTVEQLVRGVLRS